VIVRRVCSFVLVASIALGSTLGLAQTRGKARPRPKPAKSADAAPPPETPQSESTQSGATRAEIDEARKTDGGVLEAKTLDGGTRVFRFGEIEIEGRMRNPQLVYFLRRVRAEFAAGDLGHRTFMRELSDTRHDPSF